MSVRVMNPFTGREPKIAVIGLGYVGMPLLVAFHNKGYSTVGFDINKKRVSSLLNRLDSSGELTSEEVPSDLNLTCSENDLSGYDFFIVTVPTPADEKGIDLSLVESATYTVAKYLTEGSVVVFESTVHPGTTDNLCAPILSNVSSLARNSGFYFGYSPERINPGDPLRNLTNTVKLVSGSNKESALFIKSVYDQIVQAGTYLAKNIRVAESAKIMENVQRDVNIALMNEMSAYFREANIDTQAVIDAASTKWNFAEYRPGIVGGHCIGTDTYYYLKAAKNLGVPTAVTRAARSLNSSITTIIAKEAVEAANNRGRLLIMGYTFKEDCKDFRNTKVADIIEGIKEEAAYKGYEPVEFRIWDPLLTQEDIKDLGYPDGTFIHDKEELKDFRTVLVAVAHKSFKELNREFFSSLHQGPVYLIDVKSLYPYSDWKL